MGETGVGKDLFARLIHRESARSGQPLITVNCATLPESLIESELFGHRKGAFTGALEHREGVFELADGGTLFLDEIAEIPAALQSKLLRALQFGEVKRLGDTVSRTTDARVIGATSRDLKAEMAAGRFREDLYYRLNVLELRIPPLRERLEDIPALVAAILRRARRPEGPRRLGPRSVDLLMKYDWPGNVRQLENLLEQCQVLSDDVEIDLAQTPFAAELEESLSRAGTRVDATLEEIERRHIQSTLERHRGNRANAARELGVSVRALYYKIKSLGVKS
ncbi:MAG: sigma-54-dependent Fis family transcriptional regulator [Acidobacteria bacterium]|nr:sigma-54-dependent Fis family transcriptional regulator [Acidobacteriota bacterium]